jgi:beta-glucosidase
MPQATFQFPAGFLWGAAMAAYQVEGRNNNCNWTAWEAEPGRIKNGHHSGLACDWWGGRWKEDFDRAAETGQNSHRMSVEWSRIQPEENRWDEDALDYYREMLRGMAQRGLTPLVTLHHFTDPLWLYEQGAWENDGIVEKFSAYVRKVVEALKEYCSLWVTINEPNVYTYGGYVDGNFPPGKKDMSAAFKVMANMVRGHAEAYRVIHKIQPSARVGIAQNFRSLVPAHPGNPFDRWITAFFNQSYNYAFLTTLADGKFNFAGRGVKIPSAVKTQDYVGVNYYTTERVAFNPLKVKNLFHTRAFPKDAEVSTTGFLANVPTGLYDSLQWATRFNLPIMITENGVEDDRDELRPSYLTEHLHQTWRAINYNWQIKGYFYWSLVDNFEWERGWTQRFGLWGLDLDTQRRIRRPSVDLYAEICKTNSISSEMVGRLVPQLMPKLFPAE